jgi:two-component system chemotaxis sensor kinase CheA
MKMNDSDNEFFKELISVFKIESEEHLKTITEGLDEIENASPEGAVLDDILERIHRAAHSLKGAARTIGLTDIEPICQSMESVFSIYKRKKLAPSSEIGVLMQQAVEKLGEKLLSIDEQGQVKGDKSELIRLIDEINKQVSVAAE